MLSVMPRSRITRSRLAKKCALFGTIGPPSVPPIWYSFESGLASLFFFAK